MKVSKVLINDKNKKKEKNKDEKETKTENDDLYVNKNTENYLKFLAFAISQRLSYQQIQRPGNFLRNLYKNDQLEFLENCSFDEDFISKIVSDCFRISLSEEIYQDLSKSQFSFSVDSSTLVGESICALRVKYLKEVELENECKVNIKLSALSTF